MIWCHYQKTEIGVKIWYFVFLTLWELMQMISSRLLIDKQLIFFQIINIISLYSGISQQSDYLCFAKTHFHERTSWVCDDCFVIASEFRVTLFITSTSPKTNKPTVTITNNCYCCKHRVKWPSKDRLTARGTWAYTTFATPLVWRCIQARDVLRLVLRLWVTFSTWSP